MKRQRTRGSGIHQFGVYALDESERTLRKHGKQVALSAKAFDVLTVLVRRAGRLVTKDELLRRAWPDTVVDEANIHVQLMALRKVLGRTAIATVPGVGCRFELEVSRGRVMTGVERVYASQPLLFHANPVGIIVTRTRDGLFLEANDAALRLYGYSREELIGHSVADLHIYPKPQQRERLLDEIRKHGHVDGFEVNYMNRAGTIGTMSVTTHAAVIGKEDCLIAMMVDVTERKRHGEKQMRMPPLESFARLAGSLAMELRGQVDTIVGNLSVARKNPGNPEVVAASLARIARVVDEFRGREQQLLAFSRAHERPRASEPVCPLIEEVAENLRSQMPSDVEFVVVCPEISPNVRCSAALVKFALTSLCLNALDSLQGKPGRIELGVEEVLLEREMRQSDAVMGPYARLRVMDSGCGMDATVKGRLFDPFFTTKGGAGGLGLGLAIVQSIVRDLKGMMLVRSEPGTGTSVAIYLPIEPKSC
jgi:PAS domain S-box-containing protein